MLDLATALAGTQAGVALVFNHSENDAQELVLREKIRQYVPASGDPAPVLLPPERLNTLPNALAEVATRIALIDRARVMSCLPAPSLCTALRPA